MAKCEMFEQGAARIYEQVGENSVVVCPLTSKQCPYGLASEVPFNSTSYCSSQNDQQLSVCKGRGLVKKAGLIPLKTDSNRQKNFEDPEMEKHRPNPKFFEGGIVIKP